MFYPKFKFGVPTTNEFKVIKAIYTTPFALSVLRNLLRKKYRIVRLFFFNPILSYVLQNKALQNTHDERKRGRFDIDNDKSFSRYDKTKTNYLKQ